MIQRKAIRCPSTSSEKLNFGRFPLLTRNLVGGSVGE